jgi:hypothetical protein
MTQITTREANFTVAFSEGLWLRGNYEELPLDGDRENPPLHSVLIGVPEDGGCQATKAGDSATAAQSRRTTFN